MQIAFAGRRYPWRACGAVALLLAWLISAACASAAPLPPGLISASLPRADQEILARQFGQIPPRILARIAARDPAQVRVTVIDGTTGAIRVNRPGATGRLVPAPGVLAPGPFVRRAPGVCDPGPVGTTGPYRRVFTTCMPPVPPEWATLSGESYFVEGDATFACMAGNFAVGGGDGGFVYLGGWSGPLTAPYGNVDAGLQYNLDLSVKSVDDYAPFMSIAGVGYYKDAHVTHIPCGTGAVHMSFSVYACYGSFGPTTCLELDVQPPIPYIFQTVVYTIAVDRQQKAGPLPGGWGDVFSVGAPAYLVPEVPCANCVFKWMTSIGQPKNKVNYSDGATYGATWSNRAISCNAVGCSGDNEAIPLTAALTLCTEYPLWFGKYAYGARDCRNTPPKQKYLAQSVTVAGYSATGEADAIALIYTKKLLRGAP